MTSFMATPTATPRRAPTSIADAIELEQTLAMDTAIKSSVPTRWERREQRLRESGQASSDRFITNRSAMVDSSYHLSKENGEAAEKTQHGKALEQGLLDKSDAKEHRVLAFKNKAPAAPEGHTNSLNVLYSQNKTQAPTPVRSMRNIPNQPTKILDAPDMLDDYYLNLIDWSCSNKLAVALGPSVYLWDAASGAIDELLTLEDETDYVCSLKWIQQGGNHIAVGTASSSTQLWDASAMKQVRSMGGHADRISSLAWNQHILTSGSKDSTIVHHDVRTQDHHIATLSGHDQEVCGLSWSPDGTALASGGNDNRLCIWDAASSHSGSRQTVAPRHSLNEHSAAVKALAWSPHERNLVASGGGTADRSIKFWNTQTGACLNSIDTGSQVCALLWNPHEKEILSSHGFSKNELCLWRYPSMTRAKELTGHTARVLHLSMCPGRGSTVVSAGADETLRFWDIFGEGRSKKASATSGSASLSRARSIR
jgi:cell division cycle protein 20 (cofactor of APC complex)